MLAATLINSSPKPKSQAAQACLQKKLVCSSVALFASIVPWLASLRPRSSSAAADMAQAIQQIDVSRETNAVSLSADEEQHGGFKASAVVFGTLVGLNLIAIGLGLYVNKCFIESTSVDDGLRYIPADMDEEIEEETEEEPRKVTWEPRTFDVSKYICMGVVLLGALAPAISHTLQGSKAAYQIPFDFPIKSPEASTMKECSCVVLTGLVILTPMAYDVVAVIMNTLGNAVVKLFVLIYRVGIDVFNCVEAEPTSAACGFHHFELIGDPNAVFKGEEEDDLRGVYAIFHSEITSGVEAGHWVEMKMRTESDWNDVKISTLSPVAYEDEFGQVWSGVKGPRGATMDAFLRDCPEALLTTLHNHKDVTDIVFSQHPNARQNCGDAVFGKEIEILVRPIRLTTVGRLLFKSIRSPSSYFILPSFLFHVYHFCLKLIPIGIQAGLADGTVIVFVSFLNSGALAFCIMAVFGSSLLGVKYTSSCKFWENPIGFRQFAATILATMMAPALPVIAIGVILFPWYFVPMSSLVALLVRVSFPEGFAQCASEGSEVLGFPVEFARRFWEFVQSGAWLDAAKSLGLCIALSPILFLLAIVFGPFVAMSRFCSYLGFVHLESPLGDFSKAMAIALLCLLKVVEIQFLFNAALMYLRMEVHYWDAIPLAYLARHWRCNACLLEARAEHASELSGLAWAQLWSLF